MKQQAQSQIDKWLSYSIWGSSLIFWKVSDRSHVLFRTKFKYLTYFDMYYCYIVSKELKRLVWVDPDCGDNKTSSDWVSPLCVTAHSLRFCVLKYSPVSNLYVQYLKHMVNITLYPHTYNEYAAKTCQGLRPLPKHVLSNVQLSSHAML